MIRELKRGADKRGVKYIFRKGFNKTLTTPPILDLFIGLKSIRNSIFYGVETPIITTIWVSPSEINHVNRCFHRFWNTGDVIGGEWDLKQEQISDTPWYIGLDQRYREGLKWEDTILFEYMVGRIKRDGSIDGCHSIGSLKKRLENVDDLYDSLRENGYVEGKDPVSYDELNRNSFECVCVHIDRDGNFLFKGGAHHRLILSKLIGIDAIPARIIVRHKEWQEKRENRTEYQKYIDHPDIKMID